MTTPLPPTDPSSTDEPLPGEAELAALYRQLPQNEPSAALDAAVLRAAAAALTGAAVDPTVTDRRRGPREPGDWVHPKPETLAISSIGGAKRRARTPRWLISLGSAASLVLVAGLAWQLRESSPPPPPQIAQQDAMAAASTETSTADARTAALASPMPAAAPAVVPSAAPSAEKQAAVKADAAADAAKKMQQDSGARSAARAMATKPMAMPPPVAEVAAMAPMPLAPPAPPAPPAPSAPPAATLQESSANATADRLGSSGQVAAAPMATNVASSDKDTTLQSGDTPTQELDKIQQLFAQGHHDQAMQRLRAFHKAHPQWPLLPALQAHLQEP